jgi:hypothetical protein
MTPRQIEILQHSLGVDQYGRTPKGYTPYTRNFFCAGAKDEPDCRELVALGYMEHRCPTSAFPYYNCAVTAEGIKAMHKESPNAPKLTRSQLRYRRFLDADCGMSFRDWIRYEQNSRFRGPA